MRESESQRKCVNEREGGREGERGRKRERKGGREGREDERENTSWVGWWRGAS